MFGDKIQHDCISTSFLQICRCKSHKLLLGSFLSKLYSHLIKLLRPIERLPVLLEASNSLLLVIHGLMPSATMHVLLWQLEHPSDDIQSKSSAELALIIYYVNKSTVQPKLHVEVRKVLRNGLPQVAACTCRDNLLHLMLGPFFFSLINCLE